VYDRQKMGTDVPLTRYENCSSGPWLQSIFNVTGKYYGFTKYFDVQNS
jgi:hypothetical protein